MPKDTRKVLRGIGVTENDRYKVITEPDELSAMFSQERLDSFLSEGVIGADSAGEWKSTFTDEGADEGFKPLPFEETMERFQIGDTSPEVFDSLKYHQAEVVRRNSEGKGDKLPTGAQMKTMNKAKLVAQAEAENVSVTPDSDTNEAIIKAILANRK